MKRSTISDLTGQTFDLLIIGGGATGTSAARDAALRGLSVALLEKNDFGSGTSSRSTKLFHGGLRYLEKFEFGLVREACRERELMLKLAPHLAHPRPFIYLLYQGYKMMFNWLPATLPMLHAGLTMYDIFSGNPGSRRHKMLKKSKLLAIEPDLNPNGLKGGGFYYDFLTDDGRFTIETIKAACDAGALAANYVEVTGLVQENGRISGVEATDTITGAEGVIRAKQVVNTTGPWTDKIRFMEAGVKNKMLSPTKGVHIVLRKQDFPLNHAVFLQSPRDGRTVWPIPALDSDLVYVGTTDTYYEDSFDHVVATHEDIDYLLEVANYTIPGRNLGYEHIVGTWAGLRPLVKPEGDLAASSVSREHEIFVSPNGLLNIAGGKLTTARVMGYQVVDKAIELLGEKFGVRGIPATTTDTEPLSGGDAASTARAKQMAAGVSLPDDVKARLLNHYGGNFTKLAEIVAENPDTTRSLGGHKLTAAEVCYAIENEMAMTVTDFFTRRASLFYWTQDGGLDTVGAVADEMGDLLGWDAAQREQQINNYRKWVAENRFEPVKV
ncbi:FAD-dependent oxidoreductase [Candidatus Leptofilum sp.]|uniref:glycerol-3-phosphate dehydrogenase/oxidase n=1 Tax=Candidatus Leptofilum sp. TaxID=3241576 RepID=UPI003B59A190